MIDNPIRVKIKIFSWFSEALVQGQHSALLLEEELPPGTTLRTCFSRLSARFSRFDEIIYNSREDVLQVQVIITHNGLLLTGPDRLDLVLQSGDSIVLIPSYAGG
jgi:molybdopterin converting factor small subunit